MTIIFGLFGMMLGLVQFYGVSIINQLGFTCMAFNILNFGAPLAGLVKFLNFILNIFKTIVLKNRNCETLPLPLCTANLLCSMQWFFYGILVHDVYIKVRLI